jgi:hypothetical protein
VKYSKSLRNAATVWNWNQIQNRKIRHKLEEIIFEIEEVRSMKDLLDKISDKLE